MLTPEEAKSKWCPFVRHGYGSEGIGVNRYHHDPPRNQRPELNCIGPDCMAWRWNSETHGKCGLAGPVHYDLSDGETP